MKNVTFNEYFGLKRKLEKLEIKNQKLESENSQLLANICEDISMKNAELDSCVVKINYLSSENKKINDFNADLVRSNEHLRKEIKKVKSVSRQRNQRIKQYQTKLFNHFSPAGATAELLEFITNQSGLSRYNLFNELWQKKNPSAAKILFGFESFKETLFYISAFFTSVKFSFPKTHYEKKN